MDLQKPSNRIERRRFCFKNRYSHENKVRIPLFGTISFGKYAIDPQTLKILFKRLLWQKIFLKTILLY